jgi:hypothetical protein
MKIRCYTSLLCHCSSVADHLVEVFCSVARKMSLPPPPHPLRGLHTAPQRWHNENDWAGTGLDVSVAMATRTLTPVSLVLKAAICWLCKQLGRGLLWAQLVAGHACRLVLGLSSTVRPVGHQAVGRLGPMSTISLFIHFPFLEILLNHVQTSKIHINSNTSPKFMKLVPLFL